MEVTKTMVAQTTPTVNFTRHDLNVVANRAIGIVGNDKRWCDVINRALMNLASGRFSFDGHVVTLHSASSDGVYRIDVREPMHCTCKGRARGFRCWHLVAARLIVRAAEHHAHPTCPRCQASIESDQVYVGGRGYIWVDVCSSDRSHYSKRAA